MPLNRPTVAVCAVVCVVGMLASFAVGLHMGRDLARREYETERTASPRNIGGTKGSQTAESESQPIELTPSPNSAANLNAEAIASAILTRDSHTNLKATPVQATPISFAGWADYDGASVRVNVARIRKVELEAMYGDLGSGVSEGPLLVLELTIANRTANKKLDYRGPLESGSLFSAPRAAVRDEFGNEYRLARFPFDARPKGAMQSSTTLYPDDSIADVWVFERPVDGCKNLSLDIGSSAGERPRQMVELRLMVDDRSRDVDAESRLERSKNQGKQGR